VRKVEIHPVMEKKKIEQLKKGNGGYLEPRLTSLYMRKGEGDFPNSVFQKASTMRREVA